MFTVAFGCKTGHLTYKLTMIACCQI